MHKNGEYDKAIAGCGEALKIDRDSIAAHKNIAWIRATCPDPKYRDGKAAVESATRACEITRWKNALTLDALAAALAEAGNFEAAVIREQEALRLLGKGQEHLRQQYESRLALYRAKTPYRDPRPAAAAGHGAAKT